MPTTALVAEIVIIGLEAEAVLALAVFAVFGWGWVDFAGLHDWVTPLTIAAFAIAYVLGIVCDRFADNVLKPLPLRSRRRTPQPVPKMRMAVLAAKPEVGKFLEYQRSRIRVARGSAFICLLGAGASLGALHQNGVPSKVTSVVPVTLAVMAIASGFALRGIDDAYVKRLTDSYDLLDAEAKPKEKESRRVAAITFRERHGELEFLLVRLRRKWLKRRAWTFPKGKIKKKGDLDDPLAAVRREAREEAGVAGGGEPEFLSRYWYGRPNESAAVHVDAYLLRVDRLISPEERYRKPTWFSADNARAHLRQGRPEWQAAQHERILDEALKSLTRSRGTG